MRLRLVSMLGLLAALGLAGVSAVSAPMTVEYTGTALPAGREGIPEGVVPKTLSLDRAIDIAIEYNPRVAAAQQEIAATDALFAQAHSRLLPRLEMGTRRVTPVDLPPFSFQSRDSAWETDFTLSQPIYTGGAIQAGVRAARSYRLGAEGSYARARQEIAFAVRRGYYAVLTAEEGVRVAQQVVDSAVETLRVARLRYEAGVAPQFDVLAAEARVARVEQALIAARVDRDISWASLSAIIGVPVPPGTQLTTPRPVTWEEVDIETLRLEAQANRPDLVAAEGSVATARAMLALARAGKQPTVAASVSYTLREQTTVEGDLFGVPDTEIVVSQNSGFIALVANWSLFNAGQVEGEIAEAAARLRQAEEGRIGLRQQVELDVRSAYLSVAAARAQVAAAQKEVAQAEEAHRIATIRYQEGVGTSVEILSAEADLEGARTRYNQAVFGLNLSVAQLDLAVGRDTTEAIASTEPEGHSER